MLKLKKGHMWDRGLTLFVLNLFGKRTDIFAFSTIFQNLDDTGGWNHSSLKKMTSLTCMFNTIAVDGVARKGNGGNISHGSDFVLME